MSQVAPLEGVYLRSYLRPFAPWLERDDVTEILVNAPGEIWVEIAGQGGMRRVEAPEVDDRLLERLAAQVARHTHQGVNRENPLLAAVLPGGERVQMVGPPATRAGWALAIRRHVAAEVPLEAFEPPADADNGDGLPADVDPQSAPLDWLRAAVRARKTVLISGGTSSGKTTFLNSLLRLVPAEERVVLVEDTPEIAVAQPNAVGLVAVKGELGEARVGVEDLLQAALRLRPDRIIVGEIRGREAATFLRAINTGHSGSFTTVHANSPEGALEQIALMVMQSGLALGRADTIAYVTSLVDVIVQLRRDGGRRYVSDLRVLRA
ncbi:P-type DNA transfer ATPase VirB11 [Caulobacter sp. 17J65-9]|uniref:P-type DNA transfer ATPase VirB11 n=1 Tax=Caulobacter sp. 17J65-9 TaxID=2709382 RepID=UPI0013C6D83F|nr:P-type DNA transfer ATPase VirB11 [Caulobacter sp. 17J65-9]NEX94493.1 P-type DNA transfer ATPase VirB11 [Caulobacter sp. 17J65-9]